MDKKMNTQPLKGFRDFLPKEKRKRDIVMGKIRDTFELFGFEPLETPTLEYAELLLGKYGKEADKLVYTFEDKGERRVGLRYDQTVPTARVLSQYQNDISRYFRRYQIQNVFRADKPQKGRYREFTQCDIDIFGSNHPIADGEILACTYFTYKNIGFHDIQIKINSREDLREKMDIFSTYPLSNETGEITPEIWENRAHSFFQSLDKIEKIGVDKVKLELYLKKFKDYEVQLIDTLLNQQDEKFMSKSLKKIISSAESLGVPHESFRYSPLMVRGLDYYTGMIFEVNIADFSSGSLGGGGRYDNLIENLGGPSVPAVGMAFGFDRTVEAAEQLNLLPPLDSTAEVFVAIFKETKNKCLEITNKLRDAGIKTELSTYIQQPTNDNEIVNMIEMERNKNSFKKMLENQLKLADRKGIPYVVIQGPEEAAKNVVKLKTMATKEQEELTVDQVIDKLSNAS